MSWQIEFFPSAGDRLSPFEYIISLENNKEQAQILHRLKTMQDMEIEDWPQTWVHKIVDKIYQLTAGSSRIMYCLDGNKIVVLHAFKKVSQKTRHQDIKRAETHYKQYMSHKKESKI